MGLEAKGILEAMDDEIKVNSAVFSGNLSAADDNVAKALITLDAMSTGGINPVITFEDIPLPMLYVVELANSTIKYSSYMDDTDLYYMSLGDSYPNTFKLIKYNIAAKTYAIVGLALTNPLPGTTPNPIGFAKVGTDFSFFYTLPTGAGAGGDELYLSVWDGLAWTTTKIAAEVANEAVNAPTIYKQGTDIHVSYLQSDGVNVNLFYIGILSGVIGVAEVTTGVSQANQLSNPFEYNSKIYVLYRTDANTLKFAIKDGVWGLSAELTATGEVSHASLVGDILYFTDITNGDIVVYNLLTDTETATALDATIASIVQTTGVQTIVKNNNFIMTIIGAYFCYAIADLSVCVLQRVFQTTMGLDTFVVSPFVNDNSTYVAFMQNDDATPEHKTYFLTYPVSL